MGLTESQDTPLLSLWFDRFQVKVAADGDFLCRDWLRPSVRKLDKQRFAGLEGNALLSALVCNGFVNPCETTYPKAVGTRPDGPSDVLFWQFPCRTEAAAFERHTEIEDPKVEKNGKVHCYVGLPWATWIDKASEDPEMPAARLAMRQVATRLSGLRQILQQMGWHFRVHTVCQHVHWDRMVADWRRMGITDAWLSHAPAPGEALPEGLALHPWHLYAVNALDADRQRGLVFGKNPATKTFLASFIGAHAEHYLSDVRLALRVLAGQPGFEVRVTDRWHFEDIVYGHQVNAQPMRPSPESDLAVTEYNRVLSDSMFSLCPSGAGRNTLRLWESLAVGSVPVLLGAHPVLPSGGTLPSIDWDAVVLKVDETDVPRLPELLRAIPVDEVRRRQQLGMAAFASVQRQRCF